MFDPEFFPTPKEVVLKMLKPFRDDPEGPLAHVNGGRETYYGLGDSLILDPSAGSGAILDVVARELDPNAYEPRPAKTRNLHAIELDPELKAMLQGKNYRVVHDDFLTFRPNLRYDLILMNPPFSNGDEHLLHAWEVLREGDIACLLNANTITHPYTERRKQLQALIEQHGSVEMLGPVFRNAERKTNVDVALVRLHKKDEYATFGFMQDMDLQDAEKVPDLDFEEEQLNMPAVNNAVRIYVEQFKEAQTAFIAYQKAMHTMKRKAAAFMRPTGSSFYDLLRECTEAGTGTYQYNTFTQALQSKAWALVFEGTKLHDLMTGTVQRNFEKMREGHGQVAFNEENIRALYEMLYLNRYEILRQSLVDAFDLMTRYHKENRIAEGWATNDAFKVNRKVIMPYAVEHGFNGNMSVRYDYVRTINDVDRGLAMLNGKKLSNILSASTALRDHLAKYQVTTGALADNVVYSEHFKMRFFKKGTLHLWFLDEGLWHRFNIAAAQGKQWLPMDYGRTPQQNPEPAQRAQRLLLAQPNEA